MAHEHVVVQGECLQSIAKAYGFADGMKLYRHSANEGLRRKRQDPTCLHPGDVVVIPDHDAKSEVAESAKRHAFRLKCGEKPLRLELRGPDNAFANRKYSLEIVVPGGTADTLVLEGRLDGNGCMEEWIPVDVTVGKLTVETGSEPYVLNLLIDHLDPAEETSGAQARLKNLGFDPGPVDGVAGPKTEAALRDYQASKHLRVTGTLDQQTIDALKQDHKS